MKIKNKVLAGVLTCSIMSQGLIVPIQAFASTPADIESSARVHMGTPYVWGGQTPSGFDCSGYTQYVFKQNGISLPRTAAEQFNVGQSVSKANLQKGDLVFFTTYKAGPSHVGIYLGSGKFINSNSSGVSISNMNDSYWSSKYLGAKRVLSSTSTTTSTPKVATTTKSTESKQSVAAPKSTNRGVEAVAEIAPTVEAQQVPVKVMELNEDGKTYTIQSGDTLGHISAHFERTVEDLMLLNELEDTLIRDGDKLIVKGVPKLELTLFEKKEEKQDDDTYNFLPNSDFNDKEGFSLFKQQDSITKAEAATAIKYLLTHNPSSVKDIEEKDVKKIEDLNDTHWAKPSIEWITAQDIMKVDEENKFNPNEPLTTEEAQAIFDVLSDKFKLSKEESSFIKEQVKLDEDFAYKYIEELVFEISLELTSDEAKRQREADTLKNEGEEQEVSPSLFMAKERVSQLTKPMIFSALTLVTEDLDSKKPMTEKNK